MNQNQGSNFHKSANINLYAKDGSIKQCMTDENGELKFEDTKWLNAHGGALPLNQVPQQDKACIRQNAANVEIRRGILDDKQIDESSNNNNNIIEQKKQINLYAQDGSIKQCMTNEHGELTLEDTRWLNAHGGALPLNQVPQQDKACIRQNYSSVEARRQENNNNQF
jgi:hypothetical protein